MSDDKVVPLRPNDHLVGNGVVIDPERVLENMKGRGYVEVVAIGVRPDGTIQLAGSHGERDIMWALQLAQKFVLDNDLLRNG